MLVVWRGGGVQEDRGDGLGGGVRYAGYCLGPKCSDSPRNRSRDYHPRRRQTPGCGATLCGFRGLVS